MYIQKLTYTQNELKGLHYFGVDYMPTSGNPKLLILPIAFTDTSEFLTSEQMDEMIIKLNRAAFGTKEETGWYSISSFYEEESYGKCKIEGEVADWYQSGYAYDSITDKSIPARGVEALRPDVDHRSAVLCYRASDQLAVKPRARHAIRTLFSLVLLAGHARHVGKSPRIVMRD